MSLKKNFKSAEMLTNYKAYRLMPLTPPLIFHFTLPLSRPCKMCNPFFHEFRVIPLAYGLQPVCYTATLCTTEASECIQKSNPQGGNSRKCSLEQFYLFIFVMFSLKCCSLTCFPLKCYLIFRALMYK